jgi:hypothetical protein
MVSAEVDINVSFIDTLGASMDYLCGRPVRHPPATTLVQLHTWLTRLLFVCSALPQAQRSLQRSCGPQPPGVDPLLRGCGSAAGGAVSGVRHGVFHLPVCCPEERQPACAGPARVAQGTSPGPLYLDMATRRGHTRGCPTQGRARVWQGNGELSPPIEARSPLALWCLGATAASNAGPPRLSHPA